MAGTLVIDTLNASSGVLATQNGMTGIAKAWVAFVGSTAVISTSFNVSSVTRTAAGNYTISFTTVMPSTNYCMAGAGSDVSFGSTICFYGGVRTTSQCSIACAVPGHAFGDSAYIAVTFNGN